MTTYFKATRENGRDFFSDSVDYAAALQSGEKVRVTTPRERRYQCCTDRVLHASDAAAETLIGGSWPCRLFRVKGRPVAREDHKYGFRSLRVSEELPAWQALGPNGQDVTAIIKESHTLTREQRNRLESSWKIVWTPEWHEAINLARENARYAAWSAVRRDGYAATEIPAAAEVVRDLLTRAQYERLTMPWRSRGEA